MDRISRRVRHIWAAVVAGLLSTLVIPAAAWADQSGVSEEFKKRGSISLGAIIGLLCCLVVVGGIALIVYLIVRKKSGPTV
jgi:nitrate reductase gamma subunit